MSAAVDAAMADDAAEPAATQEPAAIEPAQAPSDDASNHAQAPATAQPQAGKAHELARQALKLQQQKNEVEKRAAEVESARAAAEAKAKALDEQIAAWKQNPHKAMRELGVDYAKLTKMVAAGETDDVPLTAAEIRVAELEAELRKQAEAVNEVKTDAQKRADAEQAAQAARHEASVRAGADAFVKASPDRFPLIAEFGFDVVAEANAYLDETGEQPAAYDVLAERAERRAVEQLTKMLPKLARNAAGRALIQSAVTNTANVQEASPAGAQATAPQPSANGSRKAITSKAAAAASSTAASAERPKLPWGNPHAASARAVDSVTR